MKVQAHKANYLSRLIAVLGSASLYFLVWYILSGQNEPWLVITGMIIALLTAIYIQPVKISTRNILALVKYLFWLIKEMAKSSYSLLKITFSPSLPLTIVTSVDTTGLSKLGIIAYSSSITLTPGTITLGIEDNMLKVSAINKATAQDLNNGFMLQRLLKVPMFRSSHHKEKL